jgi:tRNA(Ile)-lysidine synthase
MRILRGTGTRGLQAMAFKTELDSALILIRPFLEVTRAQIEDYCREQSLQPRHDTTNEDTDYTRNAIRLELLPKLKTLNPQVVQALNRLAEISTLEHSYLEAELDKAIAPHLTCNEQQCMLPRAIFVQLHPALQRRCVVKMVNHFLNNVDYLHILSAVEIALRGQVGAVAQFSQGVQLRVDYDGLVVEREGETTVQMLRYLLPENTELQVTLLKDTILEINKQWSLRVVLSPDAPIQPFAARLAVPEKATATLRTRRTGDRFAPLGMGGHTTRLTEWMIDHKIPRALRSRIPLLVINGEIAAILYGETWTVSERFAVREETPRVLYLFSL